MNLVRSKDITKTRIEAARWFTKKTLFQLFVL